MFQTTILLKYIESGSAKLSITRGVALMMLSFFALASSLALLMLSAMCILMGSIFSLSYLRLSLGERELYQASKAAFATAAESAK